MRDSRHSALKVQAASDNRLSAGAFRLYIRILDWRYFTKHAPAHAEFALSWRQYAIWYDTTGPEVIRDKDTIYAWLAELISCKYVQHCGRGDRNTSIYKINYEVPHHGLPLFDHYGVHVEANPRPRQSNFGKNVQRAVERVAGKIPQLVAGKIQKLVGGKIPAPLLKYSLREEMSTKRKKLNGSLRSAGTKGKLSARSARSGDTMDLSLGSGNGASAVPPKRKQLRPEDRATLGSDLSAASKAGAASPPGDARKKSVRPPSLTPEQALFFARAKVANGHSSTLEEIHVLALLEAGDTIPREVAEKFAALLEAHNPVPA